MLQQIENDKMASYLQNLSATKATDYSLWKSTKHICKQTPHSSAIKTDNGNWTKNKAEKAETFAYHLSDVFKPLPRNMSQEEERMLLENQKSISISTCSNQGLRSIKKSKVLRSIQNLKFKMAPGYDLITPKVLKELPEILNIYF